MPKLRHEQLPREQETIMLIRSLLLAGLILSGQTKVEAISLIRQMMGSTLGLHQRKGRILEPLLEATSQNLLDQDVTSPILRRLRPA